MTMDEKSPASYIPEEREQHGLMTFFPLVQRSQVPVPKKNKLLQFCRRVWRLLKKKSMGQQRSAFRTTRVGLVIDGCRNDISNMSDPGQKSPVCHLECRITRAFQLRPFVNTNTAGWPGGLGGS
jgi:hypothetical protein